MPIFFLGSRSALMRRFQGLASVFLAAVYCPIALAAADTGPSVYLEDMTWPEFDARIQHGQTTVLVPIGGTEQNGPDMALGKHNVRARLLAEKIARTLGNAVVAPVIAYVPEGAPDRSVGHMHFPGTISVPSDAFIAVLVGCGESLHLHGVKTVVFLGDHGGYLAEMHRAADALNKRFVLDHAKAVALDAYYRAASDGFAALLRKQGFSEADIGTHAGLADTALTMALAPDLVRADQLSRDGSKGPAVGLHGNPSQATAALGQEGVDLIVDQSVKAIRAIQEPR